MKLARGELFTYRIEGALCRDVSEAHRLFGRSWAPYSWLGIMNRYFCRRLYLEVKVDEGNALSEAFASETDLGSGATGPVAFEVCTPTRVVVVYENCPARTLVRVHWPMESG